MSFVCWQIESQNANQSSCAINSLNAEMSGKWCCPAMLQSHPAQSHLIWSSCSIWFDLLSFDNFYRFHIQRHFLYCFLTKWRQGHIAPKVQYDKFSFTWLSSCWTSCHDVLIDEKIVKKCLDGHIAKMWQGWNKYYWWEGHLHCKVI